MHKLDPNKYNLRVKVDLGVIAIKWKFYTPLIFRIVVSRRDTVCFGLVSLFNGISTFVDYLIQKPSLQKNSKSIVRGIRRFMPFPRALVRKYTK